MPNTAVAAGRGLWPRTAQLMGPLLLLSLVASGAHAGAAGAAQPMVRLDRLSPLAPPLNATTLGPVSKAGLIDLEIVLAPSHEAELTSLLHSTYDPGSPQFHQWLTPAEFAQQFAPTATTVSNVEGWLASVGMHSSYRSGFSVRVSEPAGTIESGLGVSLNNYKLADGREIHVADRPPLLPSILSASVVSVLGLDTAPRFTSQLSRDRSAQSTRLTPHDEGLSPCGAATSVATAVGAYTPDQVGAAYGIGSLTSAGQTGTGREVAVYELGQHQASDVGAYETCFGLYNPVTTVPVDGGGQAGASGTAEADADIEQVATQSPGRVDRLVRGPQYTSGRL